MADNKVDKTLKEAGYTVRLLLGSSPTKESKIIDITEPVVKALQREDVIADNTDTGIAHSIIGIYETIDSPAFTAVESLRTPRDYIFLQQDINRILSTAIVNSKQLGATKELISEVFRKHEMELVMGTNYVLQEHAVYGRIVSNPMV